MSIHKITRISIFTASICIFTFLYIPTPWGVPITGQTLALIIAGIVLTPLEAFITTSFYLTIGIIGIPVFSGFQSGVGVLLGPTGGYLLGFLIASPILSYLSRIKKPLWGIIFFTGTVYFLGALQLSLVTAISFSQAIKVGIIPFLPGDIIKGAIALSAAKKIALR